MFLLKQEWYLASKIQVIIGSDNIIKQRIFSAEPQQLDEALFSGRGEMGN